jgi:hypothetical protein
MRAGTSPHRCKRAAIVFFWTVAEAMLPILIDAYAAGVIGALLHDRSADPFNYRSGYRDRRSRLIEFP